MSGLHLSAEHLVHVHDTLNLMLRHGEVHFDMAQWFRDDDRNSWGLDDAERIDITQCGTTACLAGFAVLAGAPTHDDFFRSTHVADWLGMDGNDSFFLVNDWPWQLRSRMTKQGLSPYQVITEHMSELVRGVRRHWMDFDTAAVEQADRQDADR